MAKKYKIKRYDNENPTRATVKTTRPSEAFDRDLAPEEETEEQHESV